MKKAEDVIDSGNNKFTNNNKEWACNYLILIWNRILDMIIGKNKKY